MSKKNFNKSGKEKLVMFLTSALVVGACTMTGLYVNKMEKIKDNGYVVDLSELDESEEGNGILSMEEINEDTDSVNSNSVVNQLADIPIEKETVSQEAVTEKLSQEYLEGLAEKADESGVVEDEVTEPITEQLSAGSGAVDKAASEATLQFGIDDKLMWPMSGDVILNYSMDKTIYFPTLDQYKYNPAIYISGESGAQIAAAARGRVAVVDSNEEIGQFITMDLGDGYEVTYGQLQDITVKTGDIVAKGQIIANLSAPTKYYTLEGPNLYFALTKDGTSLNPMEYVQ
jgi:murein DD-endopeptidase MepM/ murein hydrolase activator NlpD